MNMPSSFLDTRESFFYNKNVKDNIKIACIGDIHLSNLVGIEDIRKIIGALINEAPDYICIVGDLIDSPKLLYDDKIVGNLILLLKLCSIIAPTIVILGNHDFVYSDSEDYGYYFDCKAKWELICDIPNVYLLYDDIFSDDKIVIAGYRQKKDAYFSSNFKMKDNPQAFYDDFRKHGNLYKNLPEDKPKILLTHSPEAICDKKVQKLLKVYDVILTGHYHNGCVPSIIDKIYPKNRGIISPGKLLLPETARGVKKLDTGTYLVLSGGWVKLSESSPKFFHSFDNLYNRQMDIIILTADIDCLTEKISPKQPYFLTSDIDSLIVKLDQKKSYVLTK